MVSSTAVPAGLDGYDALAGALAKVRLAAGAPSYAELARRVGDLRAARGSREVPGKVTVYDCFRAGRRRVDSGLVRDLVLAMGGSIADADGWRFVADSIGGVRTGDHVVVERLTALDLEVGDRDWTGVATAPVADVTLLTGLPGVGKSTTARRRIAALVREHGVDTVVRAQLRGYDPVLPPAEPGEALRRLAATLGARVHVHADALALQSALAVAVGGRRIVVLLEDVREAAGLAPLIAALPGARWLLTSRTRLPELDGITARAGLTLERHDVLPLAPEAAVERLRAALADRPGTATALARLADVAGGIPLDLEAVVRFGLAHPAWSVDDLAARFTSMPRDGLVRRALLPGYQELASPDAALLRMLGLLSGPVRTATVVAVDRHADAALDRLRAANLVETDGSGVVRLHDTVRAFARRLSLEGDPHSARRAWAARLLDAARGAFVDGDRGADAVADLRAAVALAIEHDLVDEAADASLATAEEIGELGYWSTAQALLERVRVGDDRRAELAAARSRVAERLGRFDDALLELAIAQRHAAGPDRARLANVEGNVHRWLGDFPAAARAYRRARRIAQQAGDDVRRGRAMGNLADIARLEGRYPAAARGYTAALAVSGAVGDAVNVAIVGSNRILLDTSVGDLDAAITASRTLRAAGGPGVHEPTLHLHEARARLLAGDVVGAREHLDAAAASDTDAAVVDTDAEVAILASAIHLADDRLEAALAAATDAVVLAGQMRSPIVTAAALDARAEAALSAGDAVTAGADAAAALAIAVRIGDAAEAARARVVLAELATRQGRAEEAATHLEAVRAFRAASGHRALEG